MFPRDFNGALISKDAFPETSTNERHGARVLAVIAVTDRESIFPSKSDVGVIVSVTVPESPAMSDLLAELVNTVKLPDSINVTDPSDMDTLPTVLPEITSENWYMFPDTIPGTPCESVLALPGVCSALPADHDQDDPESVHDDRSDAKL